MRSSRTSRHRSAHRLRQRLAIHSGFGGAVGVLIQVSECNIVCGAAIDAVITEFGRLDILVNNAGGAHGHVGLSKMDLAKWDRDIQLNLSAAQYCAQAALPHLKKSKGNIVNISSLAGVHGTKGVGAYSAAKAGLQMLTRVMASEWGATGVRVNCVAPGMTATEAAREGWEKSGFDAAGIARTAFPLGRYGEMREVAQMIVFFASERLLTEGLTAGAEKG